MINPRGSKLFLVLRGDFRRFAEENRKEEQANNAGKN
jgi:hypothetical protein